MSFEKRHNTCDQGYLILILNCKCANFIFLCLSSSNLGSNIVFIFLKKITIKRKINLEFSTKVCVKRWTGKNESRKIRLWQKVQEGVLCGLEFSVGISVI